MLASTKEADLLRSGSVSFISVDVTVVVVVVEVLVVVGMVVVVVVVVVGVVVNSGTSSDQRHLKNKC